MMNRFCPDLATDFGEHTALCGLADSRVGVFWLIFIVSLSGGCAVPIPPSGGPQDSTPPVLMASIPNNSAVNVSADRIIFQFNERIDERSIIGALSIFPEFSQPVEIHYKGDRFEIEFPEPLLSNTTYIVTLDNRFRDAHNVALKQPISVAFGTGKTLNTGRLRGEIVDALRGKPAGGADIFLYPISGSSGLNVAQDKPVYRIQANESGVFSLSNLREQTYFVLGLRDLNQNKLLDSNEPFAVVSESVGVSDSVTTQIEFPFVLSMRDDEGPEIRQARSTFTDEILLRFSEDVRVSDSGSNDWAVSDSASGDPYPVIWTYPGPGAREIILRTVLPDSADLPNAGEVEREKIIVLTGRGPVADSTGNRMQESTHYMALSSAVRPDEVIFVGFLPDTSDTRNPDGHLYIWPGDPVGLRFESPLPAPEDESWHTYVSLSDTSDHIVSMDRRTHDGSSYILSDANIDGKPFDGPFIVSVATADSVYTESYIRVGAELLGELSAVFDLSSEQDRTRVELHQINAPYRLIQTLSVEPDGSIVFRSLPGGGRYFIRAFMDIDGDDAWSPGRIDPFQSPEPIFWYEVAEKVRARWETTIPDTLRIPILY